MPELHFGPSLRLPHDKASVFQGLENALHRLCNRLAGMTLGEARTDAGLAELVPLLSTFGAALVAVQKAVDVQGVKVINTLKSTHTAYVNYRGQQLLMVGLVGWINPSTGRLHAKRDEEAAQRVPTALKAICEYDGGDDDEDAVWDRRTGFVAAYANALLAALRPASHAATKDRFAEFPVKARKLLQVLDGKGKVLLNDAFLAVHGRKMIGQTQRKSFLKLIWRTSESLSKKHHKLTIELEGSTIELVPIP